MRHAAAALGLIGGLIALAMGLVSFGYTELLYRWGEWPGFAELPRNVDAVRGMSVIAPILAITGSALAPYRALWAGLGLGGAAAGIYWAFGLGALSIFPVTMLGLAAILALTARRPDRPRAH